MTEAPRIPSGEHVAYYSSWKTDTWLCSCGWTGTGKDASWEAFDALVQVDCPQCDHRLCLVGYPSAAEERAAAKSGNAEAKRAVNDQRSRARREKAFKITKLVRATQLPLLKGVEEIDFVLCSDEKQKDDMYVLFANGEEIHRELAWWEDNEPLRRYCRYVTKRYGDRVKTFTIDVSAVLWLSGDSLKLYYEQADILKEFGLVEKERTAADDADQPEQASAEEPGEQQPATMYEMPSEFATMTDEEVDTFVEGIWKDFTDNARGAS